MALRDDSAFYEFLSRGAGVLPEIGQHVRAWVELVGERYYAAPSIPYPDLYWERPEAEVRQMVVPSTNVTVIYRYTYADDAVDLIFVGVVPDPASGSAGA